jgi:DNA polymerase IV (DinB-like DNA polymerase)
MEPPRIILHVDMDYFFAQVEERENPELKNKPVIVGADPQEGRGRGIVNTANYIAREYGIRSGIPISRAYRLCKEGVFLQPNFALYEKVSERIMKILRKFAVKFEVAGIDEAYLDVTGKVKDFEEAARLAEKIKQEVYDKEKITCSIGVAPNKLVAKMASGRKKPFGLTVVKPEDVKKFLAPLDVDELYGVGPKSAAVLRQMNIKTVGDLAKADPKLLQKVFGVIGPRMVAAANGIDDSPVVEYEEAKSIGREVTFNEDTNNREIILNAIDALSKDTHEQLTAEKLTFKTITVKVRYENFETHTHARTLPFESDRLSDIKDVAKKLFAEVWNGERKVRLIGVRVSGLEKKTKKQKTLADIVV